MKMSIFCSLISNKNFEFLTKNKEICSQCKFIVFDSDIRDSFVEDLRQFFGGESRFISFFGLKMSLYS